jgi:SET domain
VAPLPLIHVPYRKRLDMYEPNVKAGVVTNKSRKLGQQLILNYCFGHRESTLLLCPYGLLTSFVNHGKEPNVELRWSDVTRSAHSPEWLNKTVKDFTKQKFAVLTMEIVALRDIAKDEEILLDYGDEWQQAWDEHIRHWQPLEGAESYISADELNQNVTTSKLKTVFEQIEHPYPPNVELQFDLAFRERSDWIHHLKEGTLTKYRLDEGEELARCDILRSTLGKDDQYYYDIVYTYIDDDEEEEQNIKLTGIPREAFVFKDKPYTADFLQKHVFRHDIRIPDSIFPDSWRNLQESMDPED